LALIIAEAFSPSFGILGVGGTVAVVLGAIMIFDTDIPGMEMSWPALAALAVASLLFSLLVARLAVVSHRAGSSPAPNR
jgi:membrane-bound serine protease (ClpP class)